MSQRVRVPDDTPIIYPCPHPCSCNVCLPDCECPSCPCGGELEQRILNEYAIKIRSN